MAREYDHLFKLLIIGDSGKYTRVYSTTVPNRPVVMHDSLSASCALSILYLFYFLPLSFSPSFFVNFIPDTEI